MTQFRERGIYRTPDGGRLIASRFRRRTADGQRIGSRFGGNLNCFLFSAYQWAFHGWPDYEVAAQGELVAINQPPDWRLDELIDTGATAGTH